MKRSTARPGAFVATVVILTLTALATVPAGAAGGPVLRTFVTMFSDPGDYIGGGDARSFVPSDSSITLSGTASYLGVSVSGGTLGDSFGLTFAAPPGKALKQGLYLGAQRAPFREAGRPGIDIDGDGRGCNEIGGRFDVKDIATDASGAVTMLWLTYEQHCENGVPALFGEVRYHVPEIYAAFFVAPGSVWWPDTAVGTSATVVPVTVVGAKGVSGVTVDKVAVTGLNAADFAVRADECTGVPLAGGDRCQVWLRFTPSVAGPRVASLLVRSSDGQRRRVALDGFGQGGLTTFTMDSETGDWVGGGDQYDYAPDNATIAVSGTRQHISASVGGDNGDWWDADFDAPDGDILATGITFRHVARYPFNGGGPGMDISGNGRGCDELTGRFTVNLLTFSADTSLKAADISFVQFCDGSTSALRGHLQYRVPTGDTTPPPPATAIAVVRDGTTATISWTNPSADFDHVLVRTSPGTSPPGLPNAGVLAYARTGSSATMAADPGRPLAVAVYEVDAAGNTSKTTAVSPAV